jgi:signal transduction histidine kinase/PAS domain-containing protein
MKNLSSTKAYSLALLGVTLALLSQHIITSSGGTPVIGFLYPLTFLTAWFLGFGPAVMVTLFGAFGTVLFFYEPRFTLKALSAEQATRLGIYVFTSLFVAWVVKRNRFATTALESLQTRFNRSVAATNLGVWYCDLPFGVLQWNKEVKEHFWLPASAHVTMDIFYERIHPDDREKTRRAIEHAIASKQSYDTEYRTVNPADPSQVKVIRAIGWTDYDAAGNPTRFDGITLDNTSTHQLIAERNESLDVLNTINSVGSSLSAELDLEKLVQKVTDAATQITRAEFGAFFYNVRNALGDSYTLYTVSGVPREEFARFPMPRATAVFSPTFEGTGIVRSDDITKDPRYGKNAPYRGMPEGHLPVVSYLAVPVVSRSGEVIGGLFFGHSEAGVFAEKDERIVAGLASQAAIAMDNARLFEKATEAVRVRDEFLSISSHELRTPLTPLKIQLQTLARHLRKGTLRELPEDRLQKMVDTSERQVSRLTNLVEDLLDVSRISSGRLKLSFEDVDLAEVVREVVERYRPQLQAEKCEVHEHILPHLPARVDRLRFEQVLVNFLTNAMRYAGGKPVEISLTKEEGMAALTVKDHGIGISREDQKRIFDRFERVASSANFGGLGLGLFIVQQIVSAHSGTVSVRSEPGEGSAFTVRIPLLAFAPKAAEPDAPLAHPH